MIALIERSRCWLVPMRPVTPFMMMPTVWIVMSLARLLRALRLCARRQRWIRTFACLRQRAVELLTPVGDVAARAVHVDHVHRFVAGVGELVKKRGRQEDGLARLDRAAFGADTDFPFA